jgi:hypothetical protein
MYIVFWSYKSNWLRPGAHAQYLNNNFLSFDKRKDALEQIWALTRDHFVVDVQLYKREKLPFGKE